MDERAHLRAVARGSAATLAGAVLSTVAGFGLVLVITRTVPATEAGRFFAASAVFLVALAASGLGTDTGLGRYVLRDARPDAVRTLLRHAAPPVLALSVVLSLALAVWYPTSRSLVWALPIAAAGDLCLGVLRAHARFRSAVLVDRIVRPGLQILLVAAALILDPSSTMIGFAWAGGYLVSTALASRSLRRLLSRATHSSPDTSPDSSPDRTGGPGSPREVGPVSAVGARQYWTFTGPRAVARIAQVGVQRLDIVIVAAMLSPRHAAVYTVATRFVVFGQLANQAVSSVVQPRFTLILAGPEDEAPRLVARVFAVSTCWSILLAWPVYLAVAAAPAAYLGWFGNGYATGEAQTVAVVMALGMLLAVASGPVDTLLLMVGRSGWSLGNTLVALALDLALCWILIPKLGIVGAAVAWVVAVAVRCLLAVLQLRADIGLQPVLGGLAVAGAVPVACIAAPIAIVQFTIGLTPFGWLLVTAAAGLGYAAAVWRLRVRLAVDVFTSGLRSRGLVAA